MRSPPQWQILLILSVGVIAVSTAAIFVRLAIESAEVQGVGFSLFLAASRLSIAAIILLPTWRNLPQSQASIQAYYYAIGAGCCLGLHFATWITSLSFTSIAASTALVTTNPIWVSLFCWWWFGEKLTKRAIFGTIIALMGGIFIALGDTKSGMETNSIVGDFLALVGAWMASLYLLLGRESQRNGFNVSNYIVVAYSAGALILLPWPFLWSKGYGGYPLVVYFYVFLMAIIAQLVGHTSFNWTIRWLSPTLVTLALLFEPIVSSILGFLLFNEIPSFLVLSGGLILLLGVGIAVVGMRN